MKLTWIVVANHSRARFFTVESPSSPLTELYALTHVEGRLHDHELTSDLPGKIKNAGGIGGHAFEQPSDPKQHESERFAQAVAHYLESARIEHKFEQLLLVAEPSFLGVLRQYLSVDVKRLISFELDSNIASLDSAELRTHLPEYLPVLSSAGKK